MKAASRVSINPRKVYNLAELIDIAERNNPETRVAWERARQAAAAVGLSESAYYPFLAASAAAGYDRAFIPFPTLAVNQEKLLTNPSLNAVKITGGGSLVTEAQVYRAELNAKWLLLDFGERSAVVAAAREQLMMANVGFNATHQKIVFQVTDRFYQLGTARQKVLVARSSLEAARTVEASGPGADRQWARDQARVLQAQQQTAQSEFDVEATTGLESDARVALVESIGLLPTVPLNVADLGQRSTSEQTNGSVDELIARALSQRPDLVAKLANVLREAERNSKSARGVLPEELRSTRTSARPSSMSASPARNISGTPSQLSAPSSLPACRSLTVSLVATKWKWPSLNCTAPRTNSPARAIPPCAKFGRRTPISRPRSANRIPRPSWSLRRKTRSTRCSNLTRTGSALIRRSLARRRNLASARSVSHDTQSDDFHGRNRTRIEHRRFGAAIGPTAPAFSR